MGRIIIFPTDTVYGIGCNIYDIESINKIYEIKGRSHDKPLACRSDRPQIRWPDSFLPGPLTLILKSRDIVFNKIGYKTIGVRIPNNINTINLLLENGPMLTTSVNDSGEEPLNNYDDIYNKYHDLVDYIYKDDIKSSNISSTVVEIVDDKINILREGQIKEKDIINVLNE